MLPATILPNSAGMLVITLNLAATRPGTFRVAMPIMFTPLTRQVWVALA